MWLRSLRTCFIELPPKTKAIVALWHEDLPICIKAFRNHEYHVLISKSSDGDLATAICESWGYTVHRGSTSHGAISGSKRLLRNFIKNKELKIGMVLDGPKGPYHCIQQGVPWLSQKTSLPIYMIQIHAKYFFRLNTWDRTKIPLPFSPIYIKCIPFGACPQDRQKESITKGRKWLKQKLLQEQALSYKLP
jgi:lysophospholipid acyltransferase (LPLAT)-like uncharacterized protein